jgi:hypothetical protein
MHRVILPSVAVSNVPTTKSGDPSHESWRLSVPLWPYNHGRIIVRLDFHHFLLHYFQCTVNWPSRYTSLYGWMHWQHRPWQPYFPYINLSNQLKQVTAFHIQLVVNENSRRRAMLTCVCFYDSRIYLRQPVLIRPARKLLSTSVAIAQQHVLLNGEASPVSSQPDFSVGWDIHYRTCDVTRLT